MNEIKIYNEATQALMNIHSDGEMISLTDLWREAGSVENKRPVIWVRQESTQQLIDALASMSQSDPKSLWKTKRGGKTPGTFAHKSIALAYAKYLDPKLHVLVNQVFFERIEEEKNPEKIFDRGIKTYKKLGKDDKWIGERFKGISTRNEFTKTLAAHGVEQQGFRDCTNAIYTPLFGGSANVICEKKGLDKSQNVRDNMSAVELAAVGLSELLAMENIDSNKVKGAAKCEIVCRHSSKVVANAIIQSRKSISQPQTF